MLDAHLSSVDSFKSILLACAVIPVLSSQILSNILYNVYLHPLRHVPGPFWARASDIPSWCYTIGGKRHIWLDHLFQIYGKRVRVAPNLVLFCDPEAYAAIYGMKSNVRRSTFYIGLAKNIREKNTVNAIDPQEHAKRRRMLNTCFTDTSLQAVSSFISQHVDSWHEIMRKQHDDTDEWSPIMDLGQNLDYLVFDIMGDICFGRSFNIKQPGENPLREVPHNIVQYLQFYYPMCRSPLLSTIIWLKPRGLDCLVELITPPAVQKFHNFVFESVTQRLELYQKQEVLPEDERRQDMFYFLCKAQNPSTGLPPYTEAELRAEANLLIIAGSDTTTASLASIFWYLVRSPRSYRKLVEELLVTFKAPEHVVHGSKLLGCTYLRACVDEGMRLVPPGPCEPPREVLAGGLTVMGDHYPAGTIVGTAHWCDSRNAEVYGDPGVFHPERWIVDEAAGVTKEMTSEIRANFHPFLSGPGNCAGKNVAMAQILLVVAKTLLRFDLRKAPGSTVGEGRPELGWGQRDRKQYQVADAYITLKEGPEIQFKRRALS